jgi:PAS domain S-box-containing protein
MERLAEPKIVASKAASKSSRQRHHALDDLRRVIAGTPFIFWVIDRSGVFTLVEGGGLKALGDRISARVGRSVFEAHADKPQVLRTARRVLAGESFSDVLVVNGTAWETRYTPLRDRQGQVIGASGCSLDVTERMSVEAALRESEEKFKRVFESSLDAIVITDLSAGRYLEVNGEFTALTGYSREEVIGRTAMELGIWTDDIGKLNDDRRELHDRRAVRNRETPFHTKSGETRWALFSAAIVDIGGRPRLLSFVRDITERRRTEGELRELSGRLLQLQDQERRRIALELHDSTAQTLAALAMNLALVKKSETVLEPRSRKALEGAFRLADQCSQEIRTLSYLLHPPLLDEMGLTSALRAYVDGLAHRSGIAVSCELPAENERRLPREIETTMFRVAQESLSNIVRHSGSRTAKVRLRRNASHVTLEIRDQGRGIPAAVIERTDVKGLGVGIPGMRARVRQLGGSLHVTSGPRGATIRVSLPLERKRV